MDRGAWWAKSIVSTEHAHMHTVLTQEKNTLKDHNPKITD